MTSFEGTNSVFNITDENNSFSISIPGQWQFPDYLEDGISGELKIILKLGSRNDIELQVEEVKKRGDKIKIKIKEIPLSDFDTSKREIPEELKSGNYHDLEDSVY